jgi:hypothetical protein
MRKLIFAINTTLDGCVDHAKQSVDEEKLEYFYSPPLAPGVTTDEHACLSMSLSASDKAGMPALKHPIQSTSSVPAHYSS